MSTRRGGIPGPESRTGLTRPVMSEAEFERRVGTPPSAIATPVASQEVIEAVSTSTPMSGAIESDSVATHRTLPSNRTRNSTRVKASKPRRVQRMFALEEDLDKKLWLYAIHLGKDRSEVINDLLRPVVASMVLYDSRDRKSSASRPADIELVETRDTADAG